MVPVMADGRPLILALDTATRCSTVSLTRGTLGHGEVLGCLSLSSNVTHSRRLISTVDRLFQETRAQWADISAVAVGLGPGSFTGLRIGMATAKGFAAAAQKKLVGVATLEGLAARCLGELPVYAAIDARKKQVYCAGYSVSAGKRPQMLNDIQAISPVRLIQQLHEEQHQQVVIVGDAVHAYGDLWRRELGDMVRFAPAALHASSADAIGLICGELLQDGQCLDIASATPFYVRASDAELSLATKKQR
ncbi:MAG: tRNA (adenosine(37)-N6)-threonylcarbamoyltransferase complex dimerization subunit type 1 TsaB [Desulfopila sp.]